MSSSSRMFIDDECGVASKEFSSDDESEVSEPEFITEKSLIGLDGDDLKIMMQALVRQEMCSIMPVTCYGARMYLLHLACMFVATKPEVEWNVALKEFVDTYEVEEDSWNSFPIFFLEKAMKTASNAWTGDVIDDLVWSRLWFIGGMDSTENQ